MTKTTRPSRARTHERTVARNVRTDYGNQTRLPTLQDGVPDWKTPCMNCGEVPTVHPTELCGPCCFGEAATAGGNW